MDVRELGPALLSLGQLFDEANRVLNADKAKVSLHVKAHTAGSFEVLLTLSQSFPAQIADFLTGEAVASVLNLVGLVAIGESGRRGLLWLIRRLKGRKPSKVKDLGNGFVRLEIDGETLEVPLDLLRLYQDLAVRTAVAKVLKPLEHEGIANFSIRGIAGEAEVVEKSDLPYFAQPELEDEKILEAEHRAAYSIISLAFKDDNKWRLYDGNTTISVSIRDEDFVERVNRNLVSFSKNDVLVCMVRTTQWRTEAGLKTEYELLKVLEHRPAFKQMSLFDIPKIEENTNGST
jgi:hypothetical protein